jgi:CRISPR system Cascade subunit CasD
MGQALTLVLAGPLQSYGLRARWTVRDTAAEPTKSAMVGLLARCLGWESDSEISALSGALVMGVRVDREGIPLTDYHTIGADGGYITATREVREATIETYRDYLCDARFTVALTGPIEMLEDCRNALLRPAAVPYLGRRSCVPTEPLVGKLVEADGVEDILRRAPVVLREYEPQPTRLRAAIEVPQGVGEIEGAVSVRRDVLLSLSRWEHADRTVRETWIELVV